MTSAVNSLACAIPDSMLQSGVAGKPLKCKDAQTGRAAGFTPTRKVLNAFNWGKMLRDTLAFG